MPSPIPKRSEERRRRNSTEPDRVPALPGPVEHPEPSPGWHDIARRWYESLALSGQARYYEPSDWSQAYLWAEVISRQLHAEQFNSQVLTAFNQINVQLLTLEGSRRTAHLEIERARAGEPSITPTAPTPPSSSKARLAAVRSA